MQIIGALPILCLAIGVIHLLLQQLLSENTAKQCSAIARFWVLASLFCTIAFYNFPICGEYFNNDSHTLLFILLVNILIYIMFALSMTWFSAQNETGYKYYSLILIGNIFFSLLIASTNIYILFFCFSGIVFTNRKLINLYKKKEEISKGLLNIPLSIIILGCAVVCLWVLTDKNESINTISKYFLTNKTDFLFFLVASLLLIPFFYELGMAPFHLKTEENISRSALPVGHYLSAVIPLIWWGMIIKLTHVMLPAYQNNLAIIYEVIAVLSVITGAVGANSKGSLQRMYAYGSLYFSGCALLLLSIFQKETEFSAFLVIIIYLLNLNGLYAVGYNLKSHGTYLNTMASLSGMAKTRPQLTFSLLICIFSILGFPPLAGFLGEMNTLYYLVTYEKYGNLVLVSLFLLWMAKAYLEIIRNIYAKQKTKNFDTENKFAMFFTILICLTILIFTFNPGNVIEKMKDMYDVIWL